MNATSKVLPHESFDGGTVVGSGYEDGEVEWLWSIYLIFLIAVVRDFGIWTTRID